MPATLSSTPSPHATAPTASIGRFDLFCDRSDDSIWRVFQAHKGRRYVILQGEDGHSGQTRRVEREDVLANYIKAQVPEPASLRVGQTLYCMGDRCVVEGFSSGGGWLYLWGPWGDSEGHENENMVELYRLEGWGVRLPFPHEERMVFTPMSSEKIYEQTLALQGVRATIPDTIPGLPDKIHASIDAQIDVLKKRQTSQQVFDTRGTNWKDVGLVRLMAARWMEGIAPLPPMHRWTEVAKVA